MSKTIAAAAVAASLTAGTFAAATLGAPVIAGAADAAAEAAGWVEEALAGLVDDGTITEDQADEILADVVERVTARVNGERPLRGVDGAHVLRHRDGAGN